MAVTLTLYDLKGNLLEVENVSAVYWYPSHLAFNVEKDGQLAQVQVPMHRVHEVVSR